MPEWRYLQKPALFPQQQNSSGLMVTEMQRGPEPAPTHRRVVAVNQMKKVNAVLGFTRLDEMDRVNDLASRLVKLTRNGKPTWVPATEDRGEGIFLQLDLDAVDAWEQTILDHAAVGGPPRRRTAATSNGGSPRPPSSSTPTRACPAPRYWLLHTLAHIADPRDGDVMRLRRRQPHRTHLRLGRLTRNAKPRPGLLICTTASDSEGTLGGLVALVGAEPAARARGRRRCDERRDAPPTLSARCAPPATPRTSSTAPRATAARFASETSCEKANRFLDRRFLLNLPSATGDAVPGFFGSVDAL